MAKQQVGVVTNGSLKEGLTVRLEADASVEAMRVGTFVVVEGQSKRFFSLVDDVALGATNDEVLQNPPANDAFLSQVLAGTSIYGTIHIAPMLMLEKDPTSPEAGLRPVKTVPSHFSPVYLADENDFRLVFGEDTVSGVARVGKRKFFEVGRPLDMEVPVCVDLERFVERSNGIFGKSGTGKSFLARLFLAGIIKSEAAVVLVFDMHSEYGWQAVTEREGVFAKGLQQLFGSKVRIFSLDPESSRKRGVSPDREVTIGLNQIEIDDIALLQEELNLPPTAVESAYLVASRFKDRWIRRLLDMTSEELTAFCEEVGGHPAALAALQRRLRRLEGLPFVEDEVGEGAVEEIIACIDRGQHVVLEFGRHSRSLEYMLVANVLTRRIHRLYVDKTERYEQTQRPEDRPRQLVITIEEAHKFLNPVAARQTIFGTIAREMRKYFVTLLVIDQRPSGIDSEVLSQIGTRVIASLNDEKDIESVLTGVSGAGHLRSILAALEPKQQAVILGYAVPMPMPIRTRPYDDVFYKAMGPAVRRAEDDLADLWPDA